jgi:hypothetical protein
MTRWKSSVINCGTCVANNLPSTLPGGLQSKTLVPDLTILLNTFCNTTDPSIKSSSMQKLDQIGLDVTNDWESPVEFFAMNLLDNPPPANFPSSSVVLSSVGTLTTLATVSTSSGTSTGIHTISSTRTTSSAQATPTNWITLPPTAAMKQCQGNNVSNCMV